MDTAAKFGQLALGLGAFAVVVAAILLVAGRLDGPRGDRRVAWLFLAPAVVGLAVAVVYPAVRTIIASFSDAHGERFIGLANYATVFGSPDQLLVLRNTAVWVLLSPVAATAVGLVYAVLVDRSRFEAAAKALIFLPMAISFVGASIIWKFVYEYRPDLPGVDQIGLLNRLLVAAGGSPRQWLITPPLNTLLLVVVMIWIQAGFAMTVLSAAIKEIPAEIVESAQLDGVSGFGMFRRITLPSIRPALVVVLTTIAIWTLKVFDIVRTMTGGQFDSSVVANEFYTQSFRSDNQGLGSTLAVLLFVLVLPVIWYNIRQLRRWEA
ncbi:sugar ABC transporter permease [Dactylosporangium salmoneum]|uniref:ABC transmembrane type-1 domain-containing protein n=1 Tax=Dactylosporangium salmoneum TaxID=53361 RepID=A0ABN3HV95_9ACTN